MESLPVAKLPEGAGWSWEIKLDGWRMEVVKTGGKVTAVLAPSESLQRAVPIRYTGT